MKEYPFLVEDVTSALAELEEERLVSTGSAEIASQLVSDCVDLIREKLEFYGAYDCEYAPDCKAELYDLAILFGLAVSEVG